MREMVCALGICNGFQALIKLGLVPYGEIVGARLQNSPTLTYNTIGQSYFQDGLHKSSDQQIPMAGTAQSLAKYTSSPASHGEGRFVANERVAG